MAGNFGMGLGSFMSGLSQGANAVQTFKGNQDAQKMRKIQIDEATAAAADRSQARADQQARRGIAAKGMEEANAANPGADGDVIMNYWMNKTAPALQQHWMSVGEPEKAQAYGQWINDSNVQQGMRYSAGMIRSAMTGDADGFAKNLVAAYNQPGYFENGESIKSAQVLRDKDGKASGMEVVLTGKDGKDKTHKFNSMDDVYQLAQQFGSPDKVFNSGLAEMQDAKKLRAEAAKQKREFDQKIAEERLKYGLNIQRDELQSNLKREETRDKVQLENAFGTGTAGQKNSKVAQAQAASQFLLDNGYSPEQVRQALPSLLGIQNNTKAPSVRIEETVKMLANNDLTFGRLSPQEQVAKAKDFIRIVDQQSGAAAGGQVDNPFTLGGAKPQGTGKTPYYDSKSNSIIYR